MPSSQSPPALGDLAPARTARTRCWEARDAYFACLDQHNLWLHGLAPPPTHKERLAIDPANPSVKLESDWSLSREDKARLFVCRHVKNMFDTECLKSWVYHFSGMRIKEMQTKAFAEQIKEADRARLANQDEFWARVKK